MELFTKHQVFSKEELTSRYEIKLENYVKTLAIEARTMEEMLTKDLLPSISEYTGEIASNASAKKAFMSSISTAAEEALVQKLTDAYNDLTDGVAALKELAKKADAAGDMQKTAEAYHDEVLAKMNELAAIANTAEALIPDEYLPYPTYDHLLFF